MKQQNFIIHWSLDTLAYTVVIHKKHRIVGQNQFEAAMTRGMKYFFKKIHLPPHFAVTRRG